LYFILWFICSFYFSFWIIIIAMYYLLFLFGLLNYRQRFNYIYIWLFLLPANIILCVNQFQPSSCSSPSLPNYSRGLLLSVTLQYSSKFMDVELFKMLYWSGRILALCLALILVCNFYLLFLTLVFQDLASAGATKRPTCCVLVLTEPTKGELGKEDQVEARLWSKVVSDVSELFWKKNAALFPFIS
jgi:hypothetical protein